MNSEPRLPWFVAAYVQVLGTRGNRIQRTNSGSTIKKDPNKLKRKELELINMETISLQRYLRLSALF
jgi:hypothetical protein